jgi:hypothetical protein
VPSIKTEIAESNDVSQKTFHIPCLNADKSACVLEAKKMFSAKIYFDKQNKMNVFSCVVDPKYSVSCSEALPIQNKFGSTPELSVSSCTVVSSNCIVPTHKKLIKAKVVRSNCSRGFKGLYSRVEQAVSGPVDHRDILVACISEEAFQAQVSAKIPRLVMD